MKTRYLVLFVLLISFFVVSCRKEDDMHKDPKLTDEKLEVFSTRVDFSWRIDYPGKFNSQVEVSLNEDMSDAVCYGSVDETTGKKFSAVADNLKEATKYYYRFVVRNPQGHYELEEKSFVTKADVPKVRTVEVTEVTRTTAKVICEVTDDSGAEVKERGVCWGTSHNPTTSGNHSNEGTGIGSYSVSITELAVGKTYYVRAYAVNNKGTAYGEELSFVTGDAVKPTVTTAEVVNVDWRTATGDGEVTDDGDATVTERGICWSTEHNPEITDSHASDGTGTGSYTVNMTGLTAGTIYFARAYAKNQAGVAYGNEVSFTTKDPELPTVTTGNITDISWTTAKCRGNVTSDGGVEVIERGICWSTSHDPEIANNHATGGTDVGSYTVNITGLTPETTYYIRAFARNSVGLKYGDEIAFNTKEFEKPTVITTDFCLLNYTKATGGGTVTSDGGLEVTERGVCWNTSSNPTIQDNYVSQGGGMGTFKVNLSDLIAGTTYYVKAYAKNNLGISYGNTIEYIHQVPEGALWGVYSVSDKKKVYFSQGNLQYQASTNIWRFAEHQWDYVGGTDYDGNNNGNVTGSSNSLVSSTYSGWIDLFCFATSGYNHGAMSYQPWSKNEYIFNNYTNDKQFWAYGCETCCLYDGTGKADWGYNKISNGGNQEHQWRTLTGEELDYLFHSRETAEGIRYAKAVVNGINGLIILPDFWTSDLYMLNDINPFGEPYDSNVISAGVWETVFEVNGAVFMPAAGSRFTDRLGVTHISDGGTCARYYSSTVSQDWYFTDSYAVEYLSITNTSCNSSIQYLNRVSGHPVRLIRDAN